MRQSFQDEVQAWVLQCFDKPEMRTVEERTLRFIEEALELAQAAGMGEDAAQRLVRYVWGRPTGRLRQEVGGVAVTLSALCSAAGVDLEACQREELARVKGASARIRAHHEEKRSQGMTSEHLV